MTLGPVSYTVIAFPGNQFNGNIIPEIEKLVTGEVVRILDLVFVGKDDQGDTISLEFDQMDELSAFADIDGEVGGLVNTEDLDHVAANLPAGNSASWSSCGRTSGRSPSPRRSVDRAGCSSTVPVSPPTSSGQRWRSWSRH